MPRVALATAAAFPQLDWDGPALLAALPEAEVCVWDDPEVDWASYDLVVVRSTWDYFERRDEFLAWADRVPRLLNPAAVLRWNTDKRYLRDLEAAGVPVVPTTWLQPGDAFEPPSGEYVVKPVVSAAARDTARYGAGEDDAARAHADRLLAAGRTVMVQPYLRDVDTAGETALLHFAGEFSHAARKPPILVAGRGIDDTAGVTAEITPTSATAAELALARRVLDAVPFSEPLLYARVDVVPGPDGAPVLLELEVTEPAFFLLHGEGSVERFAAAVRARLG